MLISRLDVLARGEGRSRHAAMVRMLERAVAARGERADAPLADGAAEVPERAGPAGGRRAEEKPAARAGRFNYGRPEFRPAPKEGGRAAGREAREPDDGPRATLGP